jgi:hypothetical protein
MKIRSLTYIFLLSGFVFFLSGIPPALATQGHGDPEGLYVHQFSHIFFVFSMAILIYWLRFRKLVNEKGWKYIQYSAFFFILWSFDAFIVHFLDEQFQWIKVTRIDLWNIKLDVLTPFLGYIYYIVKLDHIFCVPAMIFLYAGLKKLSEKSNSDTLKSKLSGTNAS